MSTDNVNTSLGLTPSGLGDDEIATRATQIVQVISEENMCLRKQLDKYYRELKHLKSVSSSFTVGS